MSHCSQRDCRLLVMGAVGLDIGKWFVLGALTLGAVVARLLRFTRKEWWRCHSLSSEKWGCYDNPREARPCCDSRTVFSLHIRHDLVHDVHIVHIATSDGDGEIGQSWQTSVLAIFSPTIMATRIRSELSLSPRANTGPTPGRPTALRKRA
jgi:hypothetical protein